MAVTITLVHSGHNRLRYLLAAAGVGPDTGAITTTGAATPDIQTDLGTNQGPLLQIARVVTQGYGAFAAGAQTAAKAAALWFSDRSGANPAAGAAGPLGLDVIPTAICRLTPRGGPDTIWVVSASVDGGGNPAITVGVDSVDGTETCFLDIYIPGTIGD